MHWIGENLRVLRSRNPLVHSITNFVVMNSTANALLALGASPVMAHAKEEMEEMVALADSVVINIGTLDSQWVDSMKRAVRIAALENKPVVLDPVGAGATKYRTRVARMLIEEGEISVLRGNFSEIQAMLFGSKTRGVDAVGYEESRARELALEASQKLDLTVAVTGKSDFVSDGTRLFRVDNGVVLLSRITGTGCMVSAITGAFLAIAKPLEAAVSALVSFGVASEQAFEESRYPGRFHVGLYDWLYRIDEDMIEKRGKVTQIEA